MVRRRSKIEKKKRERERKEKRKNDDVLDSSLLIRLISLNALFIYIYIDIARLRIGEFENTDIVITTFCVINDDDTIYSPVYVFRDVISR